MSIERAKAHVARFGLAGAIREFEESCATVDLAASALGCEPARIAKTLSFSVGERVALVVCSGDARVSNARFKERFGCKARMLAPEEAEARIGHAVGGVCPFGVEPGCDVYLDATLRRFETIYPACGNDHSMIALSPAELERITPGSTWVDVCAVSPRE